MKGIRLFAAGCVVLALGWLVAGTIQAQTPVSATPSQLSVAGRQGTIETRTLLLRASDPISNLQVIPLDLARADGVAVLPQTAIHASPPADRITASGLLTVPVRFDLHGVPSGEFGGELLVSYHGGTLTVPVTVTVKDPWPLPLLVLVAGVGLGVGVSAYRAGGRPRDAILVRVGQLQSQMRADADLAASFRSRIVAGLVDVEGALQSEGWEDAGQAMAQAEAVWRKWRKGRDDWLTQLAYRDELVQRLDGLGSGVPHLKAIRRGVEDAARDAPDLESPEAFSRQLDTLAQQVNRYLQLEAQLIEAKRLRDQLPGEQSEAYRLKALDWQNRLNAMSPDDEASYQALQGDLETGISELSDLSRQASKTELVAKGRVRDVPPAMPEVLLPAPSVRALRAEAPPTGEAGCLSSLFGFLLPAPSAVEEQATDARTRLRLFTGASYVIAVALLAGAGFGELYVSRPAFGANPWGDYFALLAWGFGAEATRAAITDMVRGWGLPGTKAAQ